MNILFFDTETTGKFDFKLPPDHPIQPKLVELGAVLRDNHDRVRASIDLIIKPENWHISEEVAAIHGITEEIAINYGVSLRTVAFLFNNLCAQADLLVAHNMDFDRSVLMSVYHSIGVGNRLGRLNRFCTMRTAAPVLRLPHGSNPTDKSYKWPKLQECMKFFFGEEFVGHNALVDTMACMRVYDALRELGV
jgi:DNA polymerase III subunit epsilon